LYYFYFDDATGTLKCSDTTWNFYTQVHVATVFWNGTNGVIQKEWHNSTRNLAWHEWANNTIGTRYEAGLSLTAPTTADDATLTIASGSIKDEDLLITIEQQTTCRIVYKASASIYTWVNSSLPYAGASADPKWLDTDNYTLTSVGDSDFVCMWVYATSDVDRPIYIIPTHAAAAHNVIALARAETAPVLSSLNLNPEMKLIYRFIYKGDGQFQEFNDYRLTSPLPSGGSASTNASAVSFSPAGNIAATTVQTALEEVDTEKAAVAQAMYIGTTEVAINRTSAALTLAGITLTTPDIGVATATSVNKVTITAPDTSATLTLVTGSSLITAGAFAITLTSTAATNVTLPAGTSTLVNTSVATLSSLTSIGTITTGGLGTAATLGSVTVNIASSATGDIYYAGASNVLTRLGKGTEGHYLKQGATIPEWAVGGGGASQLSDLTDVGVTTPTDKYVLVADGDSWESRALVEADISDLGTASALVADKLSVFASTTSAELAGVISDETGTLKLVYSDSPVFTTNISTPNIVFPATQAPSADVNTLDDYEEGTWTGEVIGSGTSGTYELAGTSLFNYTKIGRLVYLDGKIVFAASITGGGTGYLKIAGLPFNKKTTTSPIGPVSTVGVDFTGTYLNVTFVENNFLNIMEIVDNASIIDLPIAAVSANDYIWFTIGYVTD